MSFTPTAAEVARSAARAACIASVWGLSSDRRATIVTATTMQASAAGDLMFQLDRRSAVVTRLLEAPKVAVTIVAPPPYRAVEFTGLASLTSSEGSGLVGFHLMVTAINLLGGPAPVNIPLHDYWGLEADDDFAGAASTMVAHLADVHGAQLTTFFRDHFDPAVEWVVPRTIDRYGLTVTCLGTSGAATATLRFPDAPLRDLRRVATLLRSALTCPCRSGDTPPHDRPTTPPDARRQTNDEDDS